MAPSIKCCNFSILSQRNGKDNMGKYSVLKGLGYFALLGLIFIPLFEKSSVSKSSILFLIWFSFALFCLAGSTFYMFIGKLYLKNLKRELMRPVFKPMILGSIIFILILCFLSYMHGGFEFFFKWFNLT